MSLAFGRTPIAHFAWLFDPKIFCTNNDIDLGTKTRRAAILELRLKFHERWRQYTEDFLGQLATLRQAACAVRDAA